MKSTKKSSSDSVRRLHGFTLYSILGLVVLSGIITDTAAYAPSRSERFYIPEIADPHFQFDGSINAPEWENANWFSFGTEGNPEITVFSRYKNDSLFLAFRIDFERLHDQDKLTICIDPYNSGGFINTMPLLRYDIMIKNSVQIFSTWDYRRSNWQYQSKPTYLDGQRQVKTYQNTSKQYAEIELVIQYRQIRTDLGGNFFGLYFLFVDWIDDWHYVPYWWPKDAPAPDTIDLSLPNADRWANGILVLPTTDTQPDIFFDHRYKHLRTTNQNDLTIKPGSWNILKVTVNNRYVPNQTGNGFVQKIPLQLYYRDFGLGSFVIINPKPEEFDLPANSSSERTIRWQAPNGNDTQPDTVSLRAALLLTDDPILCNNSTRRTLQYLKVEENKAVDVIFTLQNADDEFSLSSFSNLYVSSVPVSALDFEPQIGGADNYLYLFLDRSALDPSVPDSLWHIKFATSINVTKMDSLVYLSDRDSVWFGPTTSKTSKKFLVHFTAPDYSYFMQKQPPSCCCFWQWVKNIFKHKSVAQSDRSTRSSSEAFDSVRDLPFSEDGSPIYGLIIKVTRKVREYQLGGRVYNRMSVVGYVGVIFQVVPKPMELMDYLKWIGLAIASLLTAAYFYAKRKVRRLKPKAAVQSKKRVT